LIKLDVPYAEVAKNSFSGPIQQTQKNIILNSKEVYHGPRYKKILKDVSNGSVLGGIRGAVSTWKKSPLVTKVRACWTQQTYQVLKIQQKLSTS